MDYEAAIEACARGDANALRRLFELEAPKLTGVAQRILGRRDLAEEAVQDGFAQIWRHAARYDRAHGSARGWIYSIVRHRALNIRRDGSREDLIEPGEIERLHDGPDDAAWNQVEASDRLWICLKGLDATWRRALLMAYVYGFTHGEIAAHLGAPLGTAKAWIRRALIAVRECMR